MAAAMRCEIQNKLREKAESLLDKLYKELHEKGATFVPESMFKHEMKSEVDKIGQKAFDLKCSWNCTIFQADDYESKAFQDALFTLLDKIISQMQKPIMDLAESQKLAKVLRDDVKIVSVDLGMLLSWLKKAE